MTTLLYTHDASLNHVTPPGHPERVDRIKAIGAALDDPAFAALDRREAPMGTDAAILRCHPESYLDEIRGATPETGWAALDADTHMSPGSLEAAYRAVGAITDAVDRLIAGAAANAFVACRPPGHHAERSRAMGFCLFGTAAIAAKHALDAHGLARVAVLDFDVHHGNGTQDLLWDEARALFASSHQMPLYPGSGSPTEQGAHGQIINAPLAPGTGRAEMERAWEREILPAVQDFAPDLIVISAGFDAHARDPLANLAWENADFGWITGRILDVADQTAGGRVVSTLEGGYDLTGLAGGVAAHVSALMERGG